MRYIIFVYQMWAFCEVSSQRVLACAYAEEKDDWRLKIKGATCSPSMFTCRMAFKMGVHVDNEYCLCHATGIRNSTGGNAINISILS